jgi:hypothetical protein
VAWTKISLTNILSLGTPLPIFTCKYVIIVPGLRKRKKWCLLKKENLSTKKRKKNKREIFM